MNRASGRTATSAPGSLPAIDDRKLVEIVLTLPASPAMRRDCEMLLPTLPAGAFGQLSKFDRDRLIRHVRVNGGLVKAKKKPEIGLHEPDVYDERENAGTAFAEAVLAWQNPKTGTMPVPPNRRIA